MARLDLDDLAGDVRAIRAVALDVLRDSGGADDVVQETLLSAWLRAPRAMDSERLRAWMRRCAKNAAIQRLRGARRRESRETQAAAPEAQSSAVETLERVALQRRVAAAVEGLDEPDRQIVALRYWDGLPPRVIAQRLGLTANTVSTRLSRAKERLRRELEDERPSSGKSWAAVAASWPDRSGPALAGSQVLWMPVGAIAMKKMFLAAAACLAALVLAVVVLSPPSVTRDARSTDNVVSTAELVQPRPEPIAEPAAEDGTVGRSTAMPDEPEAPAAAAPSPTTGSVVVSVTDSLTGDPEPGVGLSIFVASRQTWFDSRRGITDASGLVRFEDVRPGDATVYVHRLSMPSGFDAETTNVVAGETAEIDFTVEPGVTIHGVVRDAAGRPIGGADVWLNDGTGAPHRGDVVAVTDDRGRYEIHHASSIQIIAARASGYEPSWGRMARFGEEDGRGLRVDLVLPALGGTIEGVVLDPSGRPRAGALVLVGNSTNIDSRMEGEERKWGSPHLRLRTDADGRFRTDRMGAGTIAVRARAATSGIAESDVVVPVGGIASVELRLEPAASLRGVVRTDRGTVVSDATLTSSNGLDHLSRFHARVDAEGRFEIPSMAAGDVVIEVDSELEGSSMVETLELRAGEQREWNPILVTAATMSGVVVTDAGLPLARWRVRREIEGRDDRRSTGATWTDETGRFTFDDCPDLPHTLEVEAPGRLFAKPAATLDGVSPSDDEPTLVVPTDAVPTASLTGRVVGEDGEARQASVIVEHSKGATLDEFFTLTLQTDGDGRFNVAHLGPARYSLRVVSNGEEQTQEFDAVEIASGESRDVGALVVSW
ncbi:MAG: sigma-70 family RNA polymerase sigma factor [Planctomycetota bacterium]